MTDSQTIGILLQTKSGRTDYEAFDRGAEAIGKLNRIQAITERALRSEDPINLYKARAIDEIAKILNIELKAPAPESDSKGQITFDDIL
jgi:hypothetical protein